MLIIENNKYLRICDWCGDIKEIKKATYKVNLKKELHLCICCNQKRATEAARKKPVWNKGLTKETDERVRLYNEKQSITKKGNVPWNKGLTKETDKRVLKYAKTMSKNRKGYFSTLQYYIDKHGEKCGEIKYKNNNKNKAPTLNNFINKYGNELGVKKFNDFLDAKGAPYSKISQHLFFNIYNNLSNKEHIYFAKLNKEFRKINSNGDVYYYDFVDTKNKKIIEFNGDDWHANPQKFKLNDTPHPIYKNITAKQIWDKDDEKIQYVKNLGFEVLIIWESDYKNNKNHILVECLNFLKRKDK